MAEKNEEETEVAGVRLTSPNKVLYKDQGITKLELAQYYERVADRILPYIAGRPISLVRCPEGESEECFFQRHAHKGLSKSIKRIDLKEQEGKEYIYIEDRDGLISLAQMGALEIHPWGARVDKIDKPDWMIFDLDPEEGLDFGAVRQGARDIHGLMDAVGLKAFLKTTGGKGLHVVVPLERRHSWDQVKEFSKAIAERLAEAAPDRYVAKMSKERRKGKIFVDYLRNARSASSVAPYSTRAKKGAPVSAPLRWDELDKLDDPKKYGVENMLSRLGQLKGDPWDGFFDLRQRLSKAVAKELGLDF